MASLTIGVTAPHVVPAKFLKPLLGIISYSSQKFHPLNVSVSTHFSVEEARNICVREALANNSDYLFFLDADILAPPNIVEKLASQGKDIISGPYHHKVPPYRPQAYKASQNLEYLYEADTSIEEEKLYEVDAVGAGCLLIGRNVLEKLGDPWFDFHLGGKKISEDFFFCHKAKANGFRIWYDNSAGIVRHLGAAIGFGDYQVWNHHVKKGEIKFLDPDEKNQPRF